MKTQKNKPTITINISGVKLRIIRVGNSPGLKRHIESGNELRQIHSHFTYEVFFVTDGKLEIVTQEKNLTCERKVVVIPPNVGHCTLPSSEGSYCLLFSVEKSKISDKTALCLNPALENGICEFHLSDDIDYYIRAFARKSDENSPDAEKEAALLAELIFRGLDGFFIRRKSGSEPVKQEPWHVGAIETYINNNFCKKITLSDIAEQVYLSTRQISRIISQEYNTSLSRLVTEKRLQLAKMLLKTTDLKISEIALQINIGAESYFYTLFKKRFGMSPLEYRKSLR